MKQGQEAACPHLPAFIASVPEKWLWQEEDHRDVLSSSHPNTEPSHHCWADRLALKRTSQLPATYSFPDYVTGQTVVKCKEQEKWGQHIMSSD